MSKLNLPDYGALEIIRDLMEGHRVFVLVSNEAYGRHVFDALEKMIKSQNLEQIKINQTNKSCASGTGKVEFVYNRSHFLGHEFNKAYLAVGSWRNMHPEFIKNAALLEGLMDAFNQRADN